MPKKLMDCIRKVRESGKDESSAWAICTKSTGLKKEKHKKSELLNEIIVLATQLDEAGLTDEAAILDGVLEKEAQWHWLKEKGKQLKDWYQTEKTMDRDTRNKLTDLRQNHWNLIKRFNTAYQLLTKLHRNLGKPEYTKDVESIIHYLIKDLEAAKATTQKITSQPAAVPQHPVAPAAPAPQVAPVAPAVPPPPAAPAAPIAPGAALVNRLVRLAVQLSVRGNQKAALQVMSQAQSIQEWGQKGMDWLLGRGEGERAQRDKQWSNFHWRVVNVFKTAYDKLNAARQYLSNINDYPVKFDAMISEIETDLNTILGEIQQAGRPAVQPAAQPAQLATQPVQPAEVSPELAKTQPIQPADQAYALMADMTPEDQMKAVELIKQLRGQGV